MTALIFRRRYRPPRPFPPSNESPGGLGLSSWHQGMAACPPLSVCHPRPAPLVLQLRPPSGVNCEPARGAARGRPKWVCVRPRKKEQHLRPLAPGLPRRPCSAACGPGPSVFTIRARRSGTDRASVSQAVACRGAPPLPAMSLGTCRCCLCKQDGSLREGEGSWAWTRRNLVCGRPGSRRRSEAQVGEISR